MRINKLEVQNFRAIRYALLENLSDMVMIAGPNGCGKSCLLDAIRLLKSTYGGYQPNEWQQWFGEFQINLNADAKQLASLFRDRSKEVKISAEFAISPEERTFLKEHAKELIEKLVWAAVIPGINDPYFQIRSGLASQLRAYQGEVDQRTQQLLPDFFTELEKSSLVGALTISRDLAASTQNSVLLEAMFTSYDPKNIGLIDYHGANRSYNREQVTGINLNLEQTEDQLKNHALYNYGQKYTNVKTEMAAAYVRDLISEKAEADDMKGMNSIVDTLKDLFKTFFPGKKFLGPVPGSNGTLSFPVRLPSGLEHDINDLSSGEKEVVFGYLRLRNTAPRNSVILLDEPELHLNPALVRGLPQFYHQHLGRALNNQIWLITHSDAFLRESVGTMDFSVFHMEDAESGTQVGNQMHSVSAKQELERAVMDLVGDLAAYRPGAKIVILEGADSEFDLYLVSRLFPEFQKNTNLLSAGNKMRVNRLHALLEESAEKEGLPFLFYTITDRDSDEGRTPNSVRQFEWDVYHIENYLLNADFILEVLDGLTNVDKEVKQSVTNLHNALKECAKDTLPSLLAHLISEEANKKLVGSLDLRINFERKDVSVEMVRAIAASKNRIEQTIAGDLTSDKVKEMEERFRKEFEASLNSDEWLAKFRGRDVLKRFVSRYISGMNYEAFRDLIITRMRDKQYKPDGMKKVIEKISADSLKKI